MRVSSPNENPLINIKTLMKRTGLTYSKALRMANFFKFVRIKGNLYTTQERVQEYLSTRGHTRSQVAKMLGITHAQVRHAEEFGVITRIEGLKPIQYSDEQVQILAKKLKGTR